MKFRLPRPVNGWRRFLGEVGVIMLGVLLALSADQIAKALNDAHDVREAKAVLALELGEAEGQAAVRVKMSPCIENRLDQISRIVDQAAETGRLPPVGAVPRPYYFTWPSGAWDSIVQGEVAGHMDEELVQGLSGAYQFVTHLNEEQVQELEAWADLYAVVVGPGRSFSDIDAANARAAISRVRMLDRLIALNAIRLVQTIDSYEVHRDAASKLKYTELDVEHAGACRPIPRDAPAHYGQAPFEDVIAQALASHEGKPKR